MNNKREIVVKLMLVLIAVIVIALFVTAVKTVIDDLYIEHHNIVYHTSIPVEPVNTKQYSDTWDGGKIVEIDGRPIKDGETVKILVK